MTMPNLKEIFFKHDFTDDTIPELEEARNNVIKEFDKLSQEHKLSFKERDNVEGAAAQEAIMSQYMGFVQGFKWAVFLFTSCSESEGAAE